MNRQTNLFTVKAAVLRAAVIETLNHTNVRLVHYQEEFKRTRIAHVEVEVQAQAQDDDFDMARQYASTAPSRSSGEPKAVTDARAGIMRNRQKRDDMLRWYAALSDAQVTPPESFLLDLDDLEYFRLTKPAVESSA